MDDFYIGWDKGTTKSKNISSHFFWAFLGLMVLIVFVFTLLENPFANSYYAFGERSEIKGELLEKPVISIRHQTKDGFEIIPLVGFGKWGPHVALSKLLGQGPYKVKLRGTLIEYNGNKLFELTEGAASILSSEKIPPNFMEGTVGPTMQVSGEIVDPKCFFGVMKPGYGKVHKSCAIRCISGQIPPILAIRENGEFIDYYFLTDKDGNVLMQDLHEYVGTNIKARGATFKIDNWKSIRIESLEWALSNSVPMTICGLN